MALTQPTTAQLTAAIAAFGSTTGDDFLQGTDDADIITGGTATTMVAGADGADTMQGFGGDDVYVVNDTTDKIIEAVDGGIDTVWASVAYSLATTAEVENIAAFGAASVTLTGNAKANILDSTLNLSSVSGVNFNDGYHRASSITADTPNYSIRRYKVGTLSTYPPAGQ